MKSRGLERVGYSRRLRRVGEYSEALSRILPSEVAKFWSVSATDMLALGCFLDLYARETIILDIGTFVGVSAMGFAVQPNVARVVSVDPNPKIDDEISDKAGVTSFEAKHSKLGEARVFDVARAALSGFPEEARKVRLVEGVVGTSQIEVHGGSMNGATKVEVPVVNHPSDGLSLVAFVDGLHTDEGVRADLEAIFETSPGALALLHDCRGTWGPEVRKGAEDFVRRTNGRYDFALIGALGGVLGPPNMGVVFASRDAGKVREVLGRIEDPTRFAKHVLRTEMGDPLDALRMFASPKFWKKVKAFGAARASGRRKSS
jgi:hypothetical protein